MTHTLNTEAIPEPLIDFEQWICWREDDRDGKPTKVPIKPYHTNGTPYASATDPQTWRDFETALAHHRERRSRTDGIGFVFETETEIVGVDLDNCRDPETGELMDWAADIVERFDSYTEVSPSGTGVHVLVTGALPRGRNRRGDVEMYDRDRFFTVTGEHVEGTPQTVARRQEAILDVHQKFVQTAGPEEAMPIDEAGKRTASGTASQSDPSDSNVDTNGTASTVESNPPVGPNSGLHRAFGGSPPRVDDPALEAALHGLAPDELPQAVPRTMSDIAGPGVELSDDELLERATNSKSGPTIQALLDGDSGLWTSPASRYPSQSEADMGLCFYLGFWTGGDPKRMDQLFRNSGLMRDKWDRQHYGNGATYGDVCVARTLLKLDDYYQPPAQDQTGSRRGISPAAVGTGFREERTDSAPESPRQEPDGPDLGAIEDAQRLATKVIQQQRQLDAYEERIGTLEARLRWYRARVGILPDVELSSNREHSLDHLAAVRDIEPRGEPAPPPEEDLPDQVRSVVDPAPEEHTATAGERVASGQQPESVDTQQASASSSSPDEDPVRGLGGWLRRWWP